MNPLVKNKIIYQIYPKSFQDSNNDGIGDIPGIISRLDYLATLGINCIWLSPVYKSPNDDNGYDISDYRDINPEYGTMKDMEKLISEAGKRGIGIIMDLVINHTSDEHEWFISSKDKSSPYREYYFWREGKKSRPPNNWTSFFGEKAWSYDEHTDEFYLHLFSKKQPDLNLGNPKVLEEIKAIMKFWLDKGIEGFRCDVINIIWKTSLANGRKRLILTGREHYLSQPGMHDILKQLKKDVLDSYSCFTVGETVFVTTKNAKALCGEDSGELDMIFAFEHMECDQIIVKWFKKKFPPGKFFRVLSKWQGSLFWNSVYFENHDQPRSISRFIKSEKYYVNGAKCLATLLLTLRGTPFIYQGQEIGMTNFDIDRLEYVRDVESHNIYNLARKLHFPKWYAWKMIRDTSRDNARTPMQWALAKNAGFTMGYPWIKVNENYRAINVESNLKEPDSVLSFYKKLIDLRKNNPVLVDGKFRKLKIFGSLFVFERFIESEASLIIAINLGSRPKRYKCDLQIVLSSHSRKEYGGKLLPFEAVILKGGIVK